MKNLKSPLIIAGAMLLFALATLGAGCSEGGWIGFYYPNAYDLTVSTQSPPLNSLEKCRDWVDGQQARNNYAAEDDYECGRDCRYDADWDGYVCKETVQ